MKAGRALVTGGARRIGRAISLGLAHRGFDVAVHYNGSRNAAQEVVAEIAAMGRKAVAIEADLLDESQTETLVSRAAEGLGGALAVLVNNASIFEHDRIESSTRESWDRHMESNLRAPVVLTRNFAAQAPEPSVDARGEPVAKACIINMVDQRVRKLTPEFVSYALAKSGLWTFTRIAAMGLAPRIRVNAIGPGPTLQGERQSATHFARQRAATVLGRGSDPGDIVRAVDFILDTPSFTGQLLCIDGGQHLGWQTPDVMIRE